MPLTIIKFKILYNFIFAYNKIHFQKIILNKTYRDYKICLNPTFSQR